MNITEVDVQKLRQELEDDLRALKRVEQMFLKRQADKATEPQSAAAGQHKPLSDKFPGGCRPGAATESHIRQKGALRNAVVEALKSAGDKGCHPREIVALLEQAGYPFTRHEVASAVVGTALQRLYKRDQLVDKKATGEYVWRGLAASSH